MASTQVETAGEEGPRDRTGVPETVCPRFHAAVELIGRRWSGAILFALLGGAHFFRDLGCAIPGVSDRLLSQRLSELEGAGLVERTVHPGRPARVSYSLTRAGAALEPAIRELHDWAKHWDEGNGKPD